MTSQRKLKEIRRITYLNGKTMRYLWRKDRPKVKKNNRKITTWIKVGDQFVDQENIRAVKRLGEQTKIFVMMGKDIVVNAPYEKVLALLPPKEEDQS